MTTDTDYEGLEVTAVNDEVSVENGTPGKAVVPRLRQAAHDYRRRGTTQTQVR
jgi:hypothetical protein